MKKKKFKYMVGVGSLAAVLCMTGCSFSLDEIKKMSALTEQKASDHPDNIQITETPIPDQNGETDLNSKEPVAEEYVTYYVVNCKDSISLYLEPDISSENPYQMPLGTPVTFLESAANGFYKIIYDGITGYALASYLSKEKPQIVQEPVAEPVNNTSSVSYVTYYVVNCNQSITLRTEADVNAGEICQVPLGAAVSYMETAANGFYKIVYNGSTGYALASYLSTEKPMVQNYTTQSSGQIQADSYTTYYVVNCKQSITLRPKPDVNSGEICQIPLGAAVSFVEAASNGFYKIIYNGSIGYSLASYLSTRKGSTGVVTDSYSYSSSYDTYYVSFCKKSITLRNSPSVNAGEICQIPLGSAVGVVQAADNGFYYVQYQGQYGYALASYLSSGSGWSIYDICKVVNCKESITLRPGPSTDSGEIRQIPLGETVTYVGNAGNGFYEIFYMGDHGYAMADYLEFV